MAINILIVDDSSVMRAMIQKALQLSGLDIGVIHQASNGRDGLEALERNSIDVVIADLNMPVMSGEEMIEQMVSRPDLQGISTIVISTEGSRSRLERVPRPGLRFVSKPFSPEMIRDAVKDLMQNEVFHERSG
jgi:two-component system chemotaxis response regulator CheY